MRQSTPLVSVLCLAVLWSCGGQSQTDRAGNAGVAGASAFDNTEGFSCVQGHLVFQPCSFGCYPLVNCDRASGVDCVPIGHTCPVSPGSAEGAGASTHDAGGSAGSAQAAEAGMGGSAGSAQAAEAGLGGSAGSAPTAEAGQAGQ